MEDTVIEIHPDAPKSSYLRGGEYGPGLFHEADCEIIDYQNPADETPRWDKEKKEKVEDWCFLRIRVRSEEFGVNDIFHHEPVYENSRSKLGTWLTVMGVPVEGERLRHNKSQVIGRKVGVEVADERPDGRDPDRFYTGKLLQIIGI